jgi:hypothetical protein
LKALRACADAIRTDFGVLELSVFGSVIRGEATPLSDVDILVSFDGPATFDRFMGLKLFLEDQLGARVDLVTSKALRPELRCIVEREAVRVA